MKRDPYRYFRIEARELLEQMSGAVLALEQAASPTEMARLLRIAHTLKGAARVVKQGEIADLAHAIEDTLAPYASGEVAVPSEQVSALLASLDAIGASIAALPSADEDEARPAAPAASAAPAALAAPAAPVSEEAGRTVRADIADIRFLLDGFGEAIGELGALRTAAANAEQARRVATALVTALSPLRLSDVRGTAMVPVAPRVRALATALRDTVSSMERGLAGGVTRIDRELQQAREVTERLRLVRAGALFGALQRLVRDTAQTTARRVNFESAGGAIRLDGDVLDAVQAALVQLVINAIVHGIETPEERVRARKHAAARVVIEVVRSGHQVAFRCRDDGRGVDLDAVRRALQQKGAHQANSAPANRAELLRTLLEGGISTAGAVTGLAGRGVGLGVVREIATRLGGEVGVETERGKGTTIELRVPVSLVAEDALIVESGGAQAAIPIDGVQSAQRISSADIVRGVAGAMVSCGGQQMPLVALGQLLGTGAPQHSAPQHSAPQHGAPQHSDAEGAVTVVIVRDSQDVAAVQIDRLVGAQSIVLRAIPPLAPASRVVSAVYLDGAGVPRPALDTAAVIRAARETGEAPPRARAVRIPVLVIDDSLTTRMLEQSILESAGYDVAVATSAEEGLEMARQREYALCLCDVEMPGMNGFAFVERCRADPQLRAMPCVLVTSLDARADRERGASAGASGYIVKSEFSQTAFLALVATLAGR